MSKNRGNTRKVGTKGFLLLTASVSLVSSITYAGPREQCFRMHNRLTGVPPTEAALAACVTSVEAGQIDAAAKAFTDHPLYYADTLRYGFSQWTNEDDAFLVPMTDMLATVLGYARDGKDFREFLWADAVYTCENNAALAPYSIENNTHYEECAALGVGVKDALILKTQTEKGVDGAGANIFTGKEGVPAGVYTTRGFAESYYVMGTNRAALRFTLHHFMCEDMDSFHDTKIADSWVRRDVDREPGGSAIVYQNECKGCHAGMDAMSDAWSYLDWQEPDEDLPGRLLTTHPGVGATPEVLKGSIVSKYFNPAPTPLELAARTAKDQTWEVRWINRNNMRVGWNDPATGTPMAEGSVLAGSGPRDLGKVFASTAQFGRCVAKKAYKKVCLRDLDLHKSQTVIDLASHFASSGYKLNDLFARAATLCAEDEEVTTPVE